MIGKVASAVLGGGKGVAGTVAEAGVEMYGDKQETRRAEVTEAGLSQRSAHEVTKQFNAGSAFWRPFWMFCMILCVVAYVVYSIKFYSSWQDGLKLGKLWASGDGFIEWRQGWLALGASIFSLATISFLGYSPFRSVEKATKTLSGTSVGERLGGSIRRKLSPTMPVQAEVNHGPIQEYQGDLEPLPDDGYHEQPQDRPAAQGFFAPSFPEPIPTPSRNYFSEAELSCKGVDCDCDYPGIHPDVLAIANDVREHFGRPVTVNSAYRCPEHNAKIGGAKNSFHIKAMAMDIRIQGISPKEIFEYLINKYPKQWGMGHYKSFVHVDCRGNGWARKPSPDQPWRWFGR